MLSLCAPALIYVAFSLTQILIDTFKGLYTLAFFKAIVMVVIAVMLNALCQAGMSLISWFIVFIPFLFMSVIVGILLYVFGFDPETGKLAISCSDCVKEPKGSASVTSTTVVRRDSGTPWVWERPPLDGDTNTVHIVHGNIVR